MLYHKVSLVLSQLSVNAHAHTSTACVCACTDPHRACQRMRGPERGSAGYTTPLSSLPLIHLA